MGCSTILHLQFPVTATDNGIPPRTGTATIQIAVRRSFFTPVFDGQPYTATTTDTANVNDVIFTMRGHDDTLVVSFSIYVLFFNGISEYVNI